MIWLIILSLSVGGDPMVTKLGPFSTEKSCHHARVILQEGTNHNANKFYCIQLGDKNGK